MAQIGNHIERTPELPTLYVVATPLGNLGDVTIRALAVMREVDVIAAEDTRVTRRLLDRYDIGTPLRSLHKHNERRVAEHLIRLLSQGKSVALVTDAGTPAIADPGAVAIGMVRAAGHLVVPIPGPSAVTCALSVAGLTTPHYLFYGFLPPHSAARKRELMSLQRLPYPLIFYEAPHRVLASIGDMAQVFGAHRHVIVARELTKLFENIHRCRLDAAATWFAADPHRVRGELVIIVEAVDHPIADDDNADRTLEVLLRELPLRQAVSLTSEISGARRNDIYTRALQLKEKA